jgi:hypothetical protein
MTWKLAGTLSELPWLVLGKLAAFVSGIWLAFQAGPYIGWLAVIITILILVKEFNEGAEEDEKNSFP